MADILVGVQAYCKILLHAARFPHCAVNGVLLAEDTKSKEHKSLKFVDCIPLFHLSLGLAPMLEAALLQVCVISANSARRLILRMLFIQSVEIKVV
jgi:hypothetical protein